LTVLINPELKHGLKQLVFQCTVTDGVGVKWCRLKIALVLTVLGQAPLKCYHSAAILENFILLTLLVVEAAATQKAKGRLIS